MILDWFRRLRVPASDRAGAFRRRYAGFRRLLGRNSEILGLFAALEEDLRAAPPADPRVRERILSILSSALEIVQDLDELTEGAAADLFEVHARLEAAVLPELSSGAARPPGPAVISLDDPVARDPDLAGGKAARLAELRALLPGRVPEGFVATTGAYRLLAEAVGLGDLLRGLSVPPAGEEEGLAARAADLRGRIAAAEVPPMVAAAIEEAALGMPGTTRFAVRSSCVGEDGPGVLAGQFDTLLGVPREGLLDAYRAVAASRFSDRAMACHSGPGVADLESPMAVLFLPMVAARAAGVLYTRDPGDPDSDSMWITSAFGIGSDVVGGTASADLYVVSRSHPERILERTIAAKETEVVADPAGGGVVRTALTGGRREAASLDDGAVEEIARAGLEVEGLSGEPQDIEWARDAGGRLVLLQARTLRVRRSAIPAGPPRGFPVRLRGRPLSPGRGAGPVYRARGPAEAARAPEGSVLVVRQATPEIALVLDRLAALVAETGSPLGHGAAVVRQAGLPAVFDAVDALSILVDGERVGVDGGRGEIYAGVPWPGTCGRRALAPPIPSRSGFAHDRILRLNLMNPDAVSFNAGGCRSIHDLLRLVHERAMEAMFRLGDRHARGPFRAARSLDSGLPLDFEVLDLGGGIEEGAGSGRRVIVTSIVSIPFRALWRGMGDTAVGWAGRATVSAAGFLSVVGGALAGERRGPRRLGDRNYLVVAPDYVNLNARLAYHYAMLDAVVGDVAENNYVNFRFQGGGASSERRDLRALFLEAVLGSLGFAVDRRGDLVNAWLRGHPRVGSEEGLEHLGRLMACARQLDMLLGSAAEADAMARSFLDGDFARFA